MFVADVSHVMLGAELDGAERLMLARNMVIYITGLCFGKVNGNRNKRRDAVVREVATKDKKCLERVNGWMQKASFARYYLSYLRRGIVSYVITGDLDSSARNYRCEREDLLLVFDILNESSLLQQARTLSHKGGRPSSVMMSDADVQQVIGELDWDIRQSKNKIRFLVTAGVLEDSFVDTELKLWAYRTLYKREGVTDMVYLINYLRTAVSNAAQNIRIAYMADKRYTGLIKVSEDSDDNVKAEYQPIVQPISPQIEATASVRCEFEPSFLEKTIEHCRMDDTSKSVVRRFFRIMLGEKDEGFEEWLDSIGTEYPDSIDELRDLVVQYLGMNACDMDDESPLTIMGELKATVKRSYGYDFNRKPVVSKPKKTYAQVVAMLAKIKADKFTRECVLAKELRMFSKEFLSFMADNGLSEFDTSALQDDELNDWVDSYRESRIEEMTDNSEEF